MTYKSMLPPLSYSFNHISVYKAYIYQSSLTSFLYMLLKMKCRSFIVILALVGVLWLICLQRVFSFLVNNNTCQYYWQWVSWDNFLKHTFGCWTPKGWTSKKKWQPSGALMATGILVHHLHVVSISLTIFFYFFNVYLYCTLYKLVYCTNSYINVRFYFLGACRNDESSLWWWFIL